MDETLASFLFSLTSYCLFVCLCLLAYYKELRFWLLNWQEPDRSEVLLREDARAQSASQHEYNSEDCPICMMPMEDKKVLALCSHGFCVNCII